MRKYRQTNCYEHYYQYKSSRLHLPVFAIGALKLQPASRGAARKTRAPTDGEPFGWGMGGHHIPTARWREWVEALSLVKCKAGCRVPGPRSSGRRYIRGREQDAAKSPFIEPRPFTRLRKGRVEQMVLQ